MGYQSTVQVIQRGGKNRQDLPCSLGSLEIEKGEVVVEDKGTLILKRDPQFHPRRGAARIPAPRRSHAE